MDELISSAADEICRMCLKRILENSEFYVIGQDLQNMILTATGISVSFKLKILKVF